MISGYFDAAIYVLVQSLSFVFLDHLLAEISPVSALFVMSGIGIIVFNLLSFTHLKKTYQACWNNKIIYLLMTASLAIDWVAMIFATYVADPFVAMASLFIALAILGFSSLYLKTKAKANLASLLLLICSLIILYYNYQTKPNHSTLSGIILGVIAGVAFYYYMAYSGQLAITAKLSSLQVLATRFWLLFIGAGFAAPKTNILTIINNYWLTLIIISFGSLIIPIYFNQQAIKKLGAEITAIIISLVPPVTYIIYALYNQRLNTSNLIICIIITMALILPKLLRYKIRSTK